jgi:hypothetical protein
VTPNLFDDDAARDAEAAAQQWAGRVAEQVHDLREQYMAVATARLAGLDDAAALAAADRHLAAMNEQQLADMLVWVIWEGGPPVEDIARDRLLRLRDIPLTGIVAAVNAIPTTEHLGGA